MKKLDLLYVIAGVFLLSMAAKSASLPDFTDLVEENSPAVVYVETLDKADAEKPSTGLNRENVPEFFRRFFDMPDAPQGRDRVSSGSGFIIDSDGYLLTNHHVIAGADEIMVRFSDRSEFKAELIGSDAATDIALLKVDANRLPAVKIGRSEPLKPGQWVLAIGSPFNFEHTVTAGIVSAKGRSLSNQQYVPFIQTDVPINRGNSGGPLINMDGEVVGINSQIFSSTGGFMGISFAIPIEVAMNVVEQLRSEGSVSRGYLGVGYQEVTRELAESLGLDKPMGALINHVEKDSAAEKAGIKVRDIIISFDGDEIARAADLPPLVGRHKPGDRARVVLMRDGRKKVLTVKIGEAPQQAVASTRGDAPSSEMDALGLVVDELSVEEKEQLDVKGGVIVRQVSGTAARRAGVQAGDIITMLDNQEISGLDDFKAALEKRGDKNKPATLLIWRGGFTRFLVIRG